MAPELRYELDHLWPSEVADQMYCEYKVHLRRTHPEVQLGLPSLEIGEKAHTQLVSELPAVSPQQIDEAIRQGKRLALCEWTLEGECLGVKLRGRPDLFSFEGRAARLTLDFKFSSATRVFPGQKLQAALYALLAQSMGFDASELCFGVVLLPRPGQLGGLREALKFKEERLRALERPGLLTEIYERCEDARLGLLLGGRSRQVRRGEWRAELFRHGRGETERQLAPLLEFWRKQRDARPQTESGRKCTACPFNAAGLCEFSLAAPDPAFQVRPGPDGTIFVSR